MFIDTHCHLNFQAFENDLDEVINNAKKEGVEKIIIPGAKIDSSEKAIEIANKYDGCFAAIGVHPHHVSEVSKYQGIKVLKKRITNLAKTKKVVAIGEFGLDYFEYQKSVHPENKITPKIKEQQKELLKIHLELALECDLPVILHCREAFKDMLPIVEEYKSRLTPHVILGSPSTALGINSATPESKRNGFWTCLRRQASQNDEKNNRSLRGVFHCFGGNKEDLEKVLKMGFYVGFDGNITFKNADNLRELAKLTPLEKILLETDSPYLTPKPFRGKRNEPKNVKIVGEEIARVKGINLEDVEVVTTNNAITLFSI